MPPGQIFSLILVVAFIFGAFYLRAYILKRASGQNWGRLGTRNIIILERFAIAKDKVFCLAEVAGKVYFVIFTDHNVTLIDSYDAAAFSEAAAVSLNKNSSETSAQSVSLVKIPTGNSWYARMTRSLARFIAVKTGREADFEAQLAAAIKKSEGTDKIPDEPEDRV